MKNAGLVSAIVIGSIALVAFAVTLNGFMLSYMWQWFVVPLGVPPIGVPQAIGIAIIASVLARNIDAKDKDAEPGEALGSILTNLFAKVLAFGIAYALSFSVPA